MTTKAIKLIGTEPGTAEILASLFLERNWDFNLAEARRSQMSNDAMPRTSFRSDAVKKIFNKVHKSIVLVKQVSYWPDRIVETWRGTDSNGREHYIDIQRSDKVPF